MELYHYNEHHDNLGRFASGPGSAGGTTTRYKPYRPASEMSDKELERVIKRIENEARYAKLTATPTDKIKTKIKDKGEKFVDGLADTILTGFQREIGNTIVKGMLSGIRSKNN